MIVGLHKLNFYRKSAIFTMLLVAAIVGYSFYETTTNDFNLAATLTRLGLALFLSIPAAYLARESSKHCAQQHAHQQTSLDLKTINPYLATLPESEQHRIKAEVANRLFAAKDFSYTSSEDSYPINTGELIMALINKLELPTRNSAQRNAKDKTDNSDKS